MLLKLLLEARQPANHRQEHISRTKLSHHGNGRNQIWWSGSSLGIRPKPRRSMPRSQKCHTTHNIEASGICQVKPPNRKSWKVWRRGSNLVVRPKPQRPRHMTMTPTTTQHMGVHAFTMLNRSNGNPEKFSGEGPTWL